MFPFWTISCDVQILMINTHWWAGPSWLYLIPFISCLHLCSPCHQRAESHRFITCGVAKAGPCHDTAVLKELSALAVVSKFWLYSKSPQEKIIVTCRALALFFYFTGLQVNLFVARLFSIPPPPLHIIKPQKLLEYSKPWLDYQSFY